MDPLGSRKNCARAIPNEVSVRLVRSHDSIVRSFAQWSRAVEPVFSRSVERSDLKSDGDQEDGDGDEDEDGIVVSHWSGIDVACGNVLRFDTLLVFLSHMATRSRTYPTCI